MNRWEYKYITYVMTPSLIGKGSITVRSNGTKLDGNDIVEVFNRLGAEGWELAAGSTSIDTVGSGALWFKRPITSP